MAQNAILSPDGLEICRRLIPWRSHPELVSLVKNRFYGDR